MANLRGLRQDDREPLAAGEIAEHKKLKRAGRHDSY
jgi:hypothetical protein